MSHITVVVGIANKCSHFHGVHITKLTTGNWAQHDVYGQWNNRAIWHFSNYLCNEQHASSHTL